MCVSTSRRTVLRASNLVEARIIHALKHVGLPTDEECDLKIS
jgi:hypothetical protein